MIDLFCGAGGMTQGFVNAGFKPILAVEREPKFADTYRANFGSHILTGSIEELLASGQLDGVKADVVVGGPPCQGFSNLTQNRPDDPRRQLWKHFMEVVANSGCKVFLIENVPTILKGAEFQSILDTAAELGFWTTSKVLLASKFGVPQNRRRAFIIGSKLGMIDLPEHNCRPTMTVRQAFEGIPAVPTVTEFCQPGFLPTFALHIARNPTEMSLKRYALIPPGGNRFDLERLAPEITPDCWKRKKKGGTDLFGRLHWDEPARCTIRTEFYKPEKGRYLHPKENRPITHWEAARLQTFPDDFVWCGSKTEIAIQIGNAVPPMLAEALANHIRSHLNTHGKRKPSGKRSSAKRVAKAKSATRRRKS